MSYTLATVRSDDRRTLAAVDALLAAEGLTRDAHLDYTCAAYDSWGELIATGSCFGNTLRCFAVRQDHRGEGLMNLLLSHLLRVQAERGNVHLFVYTKPSVAEFLSTLGFYEIARVRDTLVFMENRRNGFSAYLRALENTRTDGASAALVMNANPFTLGHQYLAKTAAAACDTLHLFVVSEDASAIPFAVRKRLVAEGVREIPNVILHDTGPYLISRATFPSYFLGDAAAVAEGHARLDVAVFEKIAAALHVRARYVGEEPLSETTRIYNQIMAEALPRAGIACVIVPRLTADGVPISASRVRACIRQGTPDALGALVPPTTEAYFRSAEAAPVIARIRATP